MESFLKDSVKNFLPFLLFFHLNKQVAENSPWELYHNLWRGSFSHWAYTWPMLSSMVWSAHPGSFPFLFIFRQDVCVMSTDSPLEIPLFLTLFSVFIDFSCFCSLRSLAGRFETKLLFLRTNFVVYRQTYFPLFFFFKNRKFNIQPIHLFYFKNKN